jgi:hypothetical protein
MNLSTRISVLYALGDYLKTDAPAYDEAILRASRENKWFTPEYIKAAGKAIAENMLNKATLDSVAEQYNILAIPSSSKTVGLVMAGNIPYVGVQDLVCTFLAGYKSRIKTSSKDSILLSHLLEVMVTLEPAVAEWIKIQDMLKDCDAYIATGSDNSARYFEFYFSKYPHIIRKNRTSIAILDGNETAEELENLADDIQMYFGLGCRNVTQIWVPEGYDFLPLLNALRKYDEYKNHDKYRNNFDYQLTISIMNNRFYMSNDSIVLLENPNPFSPISQLHYQFYKDKNTVADHLDKDKIQCLVGRGYVPFGRAQQPKLTDFPDGVDLLEFLKSLT